MKQRAKPSRLSSTSSRSAGSKACASTPLRLQRREHAAARHQRDLALGRGAAHQHRDLAERLHVDVSAHAASSSSSTTCAGTSPIEPAPIEITTSPSRACSTIACRHRADVVDEHRVDLAGDAQRARQRAAVGGDDRRLAGGIDLGQQHRVGAADHLDEVLEAVARARVAVRLEREHEAPAREGAARGRERRRHLDRVMAVVVDQREAAAAVAGRLLAVALEAAADAVELGQRP